MYMYVFVCVFLYMCVDYDCLFKCECMVVSIFESMIE